MIGVLGQRGPNEIQEGLKDFAPGFILFLMLVGFQ
jgi:hypothetical protein